MTSLKHLRKLKWDTSLKVLYQQDYEMLFEANHKQETLSTPQKHEKFDVDNKSPEYTRATETKEEHIIPRSPIKQFNHKSSKKSFKGLKILSIKVKDIVHQNTATTYRKVATELIEELTDSGQIGASESSKERVMQ